MKNLQDRCTVSNFETVKINHIDFVIDVDFEHCMLKIKALYDFSIIDLSLKEIILDVNAIDINSVRLPHVSKAVTWTTKKWDDEYGQMLVINIQEVTNEFNSNSQLEIKFQTGNKCEALQWLTSKMTKDGIKPFLFSQCQAIHARSIFPCQDTPAVKFTYTATVTTGPGITVLMSAIRHSEENSLQYFKQERPIPSYLFAIAAGFLSSKKIGPRTHVWSEPSLLNEVANEFKNCEKMIQAAEKICGPYLWGTYDLLVLPPSFPYGGMENPCLTFVTPTLLAGDQSLVNVVIHEISHSWTGNLVTNKNWDNFWLNEGHTVYLERLIVSQLEDEEMRLLHLVLGYQDLKEAINTLDPSLTKLILDVEMHPDSTFSNVPYEKGSLLLYYLESIYGKELMLIWLRKYIKTYQDVAIDTNEWLKFFKETMPENSEIDWNMWLNDTGLPSWNPNFKSELINKCEFVTNMLIKDENSEDFSREFNALRSLQQEIVLVSLSANKTPLTEKMVNSIDEMLNLSNKKNCELRFNWSIICIKSKTLSKFNLIMEFLNSQGRMKYTRPIYRALNCWTEVREKVIENFIEKRSSMHPITAKMVAKDLGL